MPGFDDLGPALRVLRERAGLSQRELAQRCRERVPGCGVTQAMLSQWERGAQRPTLLSLGAVLATLEVGLEDLHGAMAGETPPVAATPTGTPWVLGLARGLEDLEERVVRMEAQLAELRAGAAMVAEPAQPPLEARLANLQTFAAGLKVVRPKRPAAGEEQGR